MCLSNMLPRFTEEESCLNEGQACCRIGWVLMYNIKIGVDQLHPLMRSILSVLFLFSKYGCHDFFKVIFDVVFLHIVLVLKLRGSVRAFAFPI